MRRRRAFAAVEVVLAVGFLAATAATIAAPRQMALRAAAVELDATGPHEITVERLARLWTARAGRLIFVDEAIATKKLHFLACDVPLSWELTTRVLDLEDIVADEHDVSGHSILFLHERRNIGTCCPPPRYQQPSRAGTVVAVVQVRHGEGNDIFATLRPPLTRDEDRVGNVLYFRGDEVIVIVDTPERTRLYEEAFRILDERLGASVVQRGQRLEEICRALHHRRALM